MIHAITKDVGGTIETYLLAGRPATCTLAVYDDGGTAKVAAGTSATVDSVNTTISAALAAGAKTLTVASATGIVQGRRYRVGSVDDTEPHEDHVVKSVSGTTVTLYAPLLYAHSAGKAFAGLRLSYTVSAAAANALWWGGYVRWTPASGQPQTEALACTRSVIPADLISEADLRDVLPKMAKILDAELDIPKAMMRARDLFLLDLGGKFAVHTLLGTDEFRRPCALKFWLLRRHAMGNDWRDVMTDLTDEYKHLITKLQQGTQVPIDADQDGKTSGPNDIAYTTIYLGRS